MATIFRNTTSRVSRGSGITAEELQRYLATRLPGPQVPRAFLVIEDLPRTSSGRADWQALPRIEEKQAEYVAPRTETEEVLAAIWRDLLHVEQIGVDDNFFRLGGNSILATQVVVRINQAFVGSCANGKLEAIEGFISDVTDRQQMIADAIGRLMTAVEESMAPPPEFAQDQQQNQQNEQNGNQQQQQQPLIPPVAQLKLLQGVQEQVYDLTKNLDGRTDLDDAQRRVVRAELQQVVRIRAAPGVDRLVVVAHAGEQAARPGERFQQAVLRVVGVLAFVDEQVADALAPGQAHVLVRFEQLHGQADQVVEVDRVEAGEARLVELVDRGGFDFARRACFAYRFLRRDHAIG